MSLKTWRDEFYPVPAKKMKSSSDLECVEHSILKWTGLTKENLNKHNLHVISCDLCQEDGRCMTVDSDSCALCEKHFGDNEDFEEYEDDEDYGRYECGNCPIYSATGRSCDLQYKSFINSNNPAGMLELLNSTAKFIRGKMNKATK